MDKDGPRKAQKDGKTYQAPQDENEDQNLINEETSLHRNAGIELNLINKYKLKLATFALAMLSIVFYLLSLEGCHDTQTACLVNLSPAFIHGLVFYLMMSSFLYSIVIYLTINGNLNSRPLLVLTVIFFYLTTIHDTGSDLAHHGSYNRGIFVVAVPACLFGIYIMLFFYHLMKSKYYKLIALLTIIIVTSTTFVYFQLRTGCAERWSEGYYGKTIDNTNAPFNSCRIRIPRFCWVDLLDGWLDVSYWLSEDCQNFRLGERTQFLRYLPTQIRNDSLVYYYPHTNTMSYIPDSMFDQFFYNLMDNVGTERDERHSEVMLSFDNKTNLGKITINIERNESLVSLRREQALNSPNKVKSKNILMIYIDSISRRHFIRKMKNTMRVVQDYLVKTGDYSFYQFMKYQAFIYFTQLNTNPMFYGKSMYTKSGTHILKHFHENGFITGHTNNLCSRELYDIEKGYIENVTYIPFDHENAALFCDPNFFNVENPYTPYMGPYSVKRRCLYGRDTFSYVLEYGEKFWETYLNERKFLRIAFQDAHEGTGEAVTYLDRELAIFLTNFIKKGWLEDTSIIFVADHGNAMIGFHNVFEVDDFVTEKTLPILLFLFPKSMFADGSINKEEVDKNLEYNSNVMVTPYDIYNTLVDLLGYSPNTFNQYGDSLMRKIQDVEQRNCKKYEKDMIKLWCRCVD